MIPDLNIFARTVRTLALNGRNVAVTDVMGERFMASLQPPISSRTNDGSPREGSVYVARWRTGKLGPLVAPQAGWRVSLTRPTSSRTYENMVYELLGDPREIRNGANSTGVQAEVMPVGALYPYTAVLKEQNGVVVGNILVALWSEREGHGDTGTYEDFSGEAPIDQAAAIKVNRKLDINGEIYRLVSAIVDLEGPRVKFTARRANT